MSNQPVTQWFGPTQTPEREGPYEVETRHNFPFPVYCYWGEQQWGEPSVGVEEAVNCRDMIARDQCRRWRGLADNPDSKSAALYSEWKLGMPKNVVAPRIDMLDEWKAGSAEFNGQLDVTLTHIAEQVRGL